MIPRPKLPEDLTKDELRSLLIEKQRSDRRLRMDYFQRVGRILPIESMTSTENFPPSLQSQTKTGKAVVEDGSIPQGINPKKNLKRPWLERTLNFIEIGAVIGLIAVVIFIFSKFNSLNAEPSLALQQQPTFTATPIINAVVLPSGHTSPNSPGGVQPNDAEIPEHLRPLVQSMAKIPFPTPGPEQAVRLQAPSISVDAPVIQGDGWEQLKKGIGQHLGSPSPGQKGNIVLSAHDDVFGEIFRNLDHLREGDKIILFSSQRAFTYVVRQSQVVEPTKIDVMNQTQDPIITLISCYPYLVDNKRIVVTAYLEQ